MKGEEKAREDISKASEKVENKIDVRGSGKNAKLRSIGNMRQQEMQNTFKDLSLEELAQLKSTINK